MSVGSHSFGVVRLRMMLQGTSKRTFDCQLKHPEVFTPRETYIADEIYRQSQQVLIASDMQILRQAVQLCISNCGRYERLSLGAVEEGTYCCSYPRTITDTTTLEAEEVSNLISSTKPSH
jgi:hypothetical protein